MTSATPARKGRYLDLAFITTAIGLLLAAVVGWRMEGGLSGALNMLFITAVLSVLEISLSFDNAIVNANKLKTMTELWRRRFLTWGILIAVFGMRILFPLVIVALAAKVGPFEAASLAVSEPERYTEIMHDAELSISAFGATFLMLVALSYFVDEEKDVDWLVHIERRLRGLASLKGAVVAFVLLLVTMASSTFPPEQSAEFLKAAVWGLLTFLAVDLLSEYLDASNAAKTAAQGGLGAFLYLEVLDASFSFDGVIGAFALSNNLIVIAIGLGIGAMYVRSLTIMMVEKGTLTEYRYLEHGAFYSIFFLAVIMYLKPVIKIPEAITGLGGAVLIGLSFWASLRHRKMEQAG